MKLNITNYTISKWLHKAPIVFFFFFSNAMMICHYIQISKHNSTLIAENSPTQSESRNVTEASRIPVVFIFQPTEKYRFENGAHGVSRVRGARFTRTRLTSVQVRAGGVRGLDVTARQRQVRGIVFVGHLQPVQLQHGGRYLHLGLVHYRSALHAQRGQQVPLRLAGVLERGPSARRSRRFAAHYAWYHSHHQQHTAYHCRSSTCKR